MEADIDARKSELMTDEKPDKKPKPRRTGQRGTIVAGRSRQRREAPSNE
jgi:hypothetical protein